VKLAPLDDQLPLCWPADVLYAKMTDLLFYAPHNSSLLYDCEYAFDPLPEDSLPSSNPFPGRPWISDPQCKAIAARRDAFKANLNALDQEMFSDPSGVAAKLGFPRVQPPDTVPEKDKAQFRVQQCIGAAIQY